MFAFAFCLCLAAHVLQGVLMPAATLLVFAPFVALCAMKMGLRGSLWLAALAGCVVDLFSEDPIGLHALNYVLAAAAVYRWRKRFSYEEPLHLGIYTAAISFLSTLLQLFLLFLFDRRVPIQGQWVVIDLVCMPIADGIYGLVWLWGPLWVVRKVRHKWVIYCLRKKTLSRI